MVRIQGCNIFRYERSNFPPILPCLTCNLRVLRCLTESFNNLNIKKSKYFIFNNIFIPPPNKLTNSYCIVHKSQYVLSFTETYKLIVGLGVGIPLFVIAVLVFVIICVYCRRKRYRKSSFSSDDDDLDRWAFFVTISLI